MPNISIGKLNNTSIPSGSGSIKAYSDNGLIMAVDPVVPVIILDLPNLSSEVVYIFDSDLFIKAIHLSTTNVNFTLKVETPNNVQFLNLVTQASIVNATIPVVAGESIKLSAASSLNARLVMRKAGIEVKL
jgi:hypothetical protein